MTVRERAVVLLASVALSAVAAATASGALPEITKPGSAAELTKKAITLKGGEVHFELASGINFTCTGYAATGSGVGTKKVINTLVRYTGCASGAFSCQSAGASTKEIMTNPIEGEIGYIGATSKKEVGLDLWPTGRTAMEKTLHEFNALVAKFTCAGFLNDLLKGSVIARVTPVDKSVKPGNPFTLGYKRGINGGEQELMSLKGVEGGAVDVLEASFGGGGFEKISQEGSEELTFEETAELKA